MKLQKHLLARNLRGQQALGRIRELVLREEPGPGRHGSREMTLQIFDAVAAQAGNHKDRIEIPGFCQLRSQREQAVTAHQIDFVQRQDRPAPPISEMVENAPDIRTDPARRIDQQHGLIGIFGTRPGRRDHRPIEPPAWRKDARRVDVNDLRRALDRDPEQPCARRLRFRRDDGEFATD